MIRYVEEQNGIASVVHRDGTRTQFVCGVSDTLIGWDEEEICYLTPMGEANFFSATGENRGCYQIESSCNPISFNCGTLLFEDTRLRQRFKYDRETGQTREADR